MNHFFAYMARMKLIRRWSLMRNTQPENDAEHSLQVAMIAHALAVIRRDKYHGSVDPEHVAVLAIYHDADEVLTGDLPTPVKYHSEEMRAAFREVENQAGNRLLGMLPGEMRDAYLPYLTPADDDAHRLVKAADRISAYVKCLEEQRAGNHEFDAAGSNILASINALDMPEVRDFMRDFIPSFTMTLDELNSPCGDPSSEN